MSLVEFQTLLCYGGAIALSAIEEAKRKLGAQCMIVGEGGVTQAAVSMHWREPILKRPRIRQPRLRAKRTTPHAGVCASPLANYERVHQ
jgi:hypothetical protein